MLVGTQSGLYDLRGEKLVPIGLDSGLRSDMDVTAIHELAGGEWVIGTLAEEMYVSDGTRWHRFGVEQGMPSNAPFFMAEDGTGYLWVAGIRGITRVATVQLRE